VNEKERVPKPKLWGRAVNGIKLPDG